MSPRTGRLHQIRRHFNHISHPLIGDTTHGDSAHNRFFREKLPDSGLFLKAESLELKHPSGDANLRVRSSWNHGWHQLFDLLGVCPWLVGRP